MNCDMKCILVGLTTKVAFYNISYTKNEQNINIGNIRLLYLIFNRTKLKWWATRNEIKYKRTEANDMVKVKSRHKGTNQSTHIEQKRLAIY